jgi:hypothetical protein
VSRRLAVVVALIAGLLGMHGFTSNHGPMPPTASHGTAAHIPAADDAMAMSVHSNDQAAVAAAEPMAVRAMAAAGDAMAMWAGSTDLADSAAASGGGAAASAAASLVGGAGHAMGALCLAILTGLGWLLLSLLLGRRARWAAPVAGDLRGYARAAEPVPPSLSELCVLRT